MFEIKRSILSSVGMILLAGLFLAGYIFDFLSDDFALVGEFNEELGPLFGPLLYWAFFLALLWALFVFGKLLISNDPVITMDTNEIKFHAPIKGFSSKSFTMQWKEIESIQRGYQNVPFSGEKIEYLVITPFNEEAAKKYNSLNVKSDEFMSLGMSYDMNKRVGIPLKGLKLKPKEILVLAKKFLAENS
tara:strand:- start:277 stop:843 length:567 start_codon:yes stop_codon:yes gene_type:complete